MRVEVDVALRRQPTGGRVGAEWRCRPRARSAAAVSSTASASGVGWPSVGIAGARHDRGEREHPLRALDRHGLGDHPAHRRADDVGPVDAEVVEQADGVVGHVRQRVGHLGQRRRHDSGRRPHEPRATATARRGWSTARRRGCRSGSRGAPGRRAGSQNPASQAISWAAKPITSSSGGIVGSTERLVLDLDP